LTRAPASDEVISDEADFTIEEAEVEREKVNRELSGEIAGVVQSKSGVMTDLGLEYHQKHYDFWMKYFTNRDTERFERHMVNGEKFYDLVERIFSEYGLPKDLFYVGLIESGYNMSIRSHADAVGPWQFIKGTAHRYGLRVDKSVDERQNIHKATAAAARYFRDLYNIFGSWELALCAYNAGEYRIIGAIRKGKTRDYRELVEKGLLPKETIYYIPKVVAAKTIAKKMGRFESKSETSKIYMGAQLLEISQSFSIKSLAKATGLTTTTLQTLNPDIKANWVRVGKAKFKVVVPTKSIESMASLTIPEPTPSRSLSQTKRRVARAEIAGKILTYRVKRGDTLIGIARTFGVSIGGIKTANGLRSSRVMIGQKLKIPNIKVRQYVVKRGDNLHQIARRFGTSIGKLKALNNLSSRGVIYPAQEIKIPTDG
jgi:membrane-bound lytic murein transglycosylase D